MNSSITRTFFTAVALLLFQVFVLNKLLIAASYTAFLYTIVILLYPFYKNRALFLILSFMYGLLIDLFENTGGIHAAAAVTIAFIRPVLMQLTLAFLLL